MRVWLFLFLLYLSVVSLCFGDVRADFLVAAQTKLNQAFNDSNASYEELRKAYLNYYNTVPLRDEYFNGFEEALRLAQMARASKIDKIDDEVFITLGARVLRDSSATAEARKYFDEIELWLDSRQSTPFALKTYRSLVGRFHNEDETRQTVHSLIGDLKQYANRAQVFLEAIEILWSVGNDESILVVRKAIEQLEEAKEATDETRTQGYTLLAFLGDDSDATINFLNTVYALDTHARLLDHKRRAISRKKLFARGHELFHVENPPNPESTAMGPYANLAFNLMVLGDIKIFEFLGGHFKFSQSPYFYGSTVQLDPAVFDVVPEDFEDSTNWYFMNELLRTVLTELPVILDYGFKKNYLIPHEMYYYNYYNNKKGTTCTT